MLYIDQPFGAGFSYSTQRIDTTDAAASVVLGIPSGLL